MDKPEPKQVLSPAPKAEAKAPLQLVKPKVPEPWSPAEATSRLNAMAADPESFDLSFKLHAFEQMEERDITAVDAIHVMRTGFVFDAPVAATQPGLYRYTMRGLTPSSNRREVRIVVIPSMHKAWAKIITVMWADEPMTRGTGR